MATPMAVPTSVRCFVPPIPPKTPKSAGTRHRLLDVAAQLFIDQGYEAVSMRDIAAAAQVSKGAVYGHFRSKGQMLVEVICWKLAESDQATHFAEVGTSLERGAELIHDQGNRKTRLLEVDAAAARHDPDVAAGLRDLHLERHAQIREAMSDIPYPDAAAWVVSALTAGIGMKESSGLPLPEANRLTAAIADALRGAVSPA